MFNILFNKLKSKDRGDGFNSYTGTANLCDKDGNKKGEMTIEIPKGKLEDGELTVYADFDLNQKLYKKNAKRAIRSTKQYCRCCFNGILTPASSAQRLSE